MWDQCHRGSPHGPDLLYCVSLLLPQPRGLLKPGLQSWPGSLCRILRTAQGAVTTGGTRRRPCHFPLPPRCPGVSTQVHQLRSRWGLCTLQLRSALCAPGTVSSLHLPPALYPTMRDRLHPHPSKPSLTQSSRWPQVCPSAPTSRHASPSICPRTLSSQHVTYFPEAQVLHPLSPSPQATPWLPHLAFHMDGPLPRGPGRACCIGVGGAGAGLVASWTPQGGQQAGPAHMARSPALCHPAPPHGGPLAWQELPAEYFMGDT